MLGPDDLVLCAGTLGSAPLREKIEAAADAGFRGVSLYPADLQQAVQHLARLGSIAYNSVDGFDLTVGQMAKSFLLFK